MAVINYLEAAFHRTAGKEMQRALRQKGLLPQEPDAKMPEPYRLWKACEQHNTLWWSGGISNQPYIMMREFDACQAATRVFETQVENYRRILQDK